MYVLHRILVSPYSLNVNSRTLCTKCQAIVSTGLPFIAGPDSIVNSFHTNIGAVATNGFNAVSCNTIASLPSISFFFDIF